MLPGLSALSGLLELPGLPEPPELLRLLRLSVLPGILEPELTGLSVIPRVFSCTKSPRAFKFRGSQVSRASRSPRAHSAHRAHKSPTDARAARNPKASKACRGSRAPTVSRAIRTSRAIRLLKLQVFLELPRISGLPVLLRRSLSTLRTSRASSAY